LAPAATVAILVCVSTGCVTGPGGAGLPSFFDTAQMASNDYPFGTAGTTIALDGTDQLQFGLNGVADDTTVRVGQFTPVPDAAFWRMFTPRYSVAMLSGGHAGGGPIILSVDFGDLTYADYEGMGLYDWFDLPGTVRSLAAGDTPPSYWRPLAHHFYPEPPLRVASASILGSLLVRSASEVSARLLGSGNFAGFAARAAWSSHVNTAWLTPPAAPAGTHHVGVTVVIDFVAVHSTVPEGYQRVSGEVQDVKSETIVVGGTTQSDIVVVHTFAPD